MEAPRWFATSFWVLLDALSAHILRRETVSSGMNIPDEALHEYKSAQMNRDKLKCIALSKFSLRFASFSGNYQTNLMLSTRLIIFPPTIVDDVNNASGEILTIIPAQVLHVPLIFMSCNPWETINLSKSLGISPATMKMKREQAMVWRTSTQWFR